MGYRLSQSGLDRALAGLGGANRLFAPRRYRGEGEFSDTDSIRYGEIKTASDMELAEKSSHTFKEVITPISETLFFFTDDTVQQATAQTDRAIVFLRSCDMHAVKRQDEIYLRNGRTEDPYYRRLRDRVQFILIGCPHPFENCFCVDMGTNVSDEYAASLDFRDGSYYMDCKNPDWDELLRDCAEEILDVAPAHVDDTPKRVNIPDNLDASVARSHMWDEYDARCIACGRCNFCCPTCTCYSMQDIFYTDNGKVGERRRTWAGCMVDGFTDVAGGGSYRQKYGQRMRFKVLHKVLDYKQRFGYHMCVGCGRCDDVCPEYISFSGSINKLGDAMKEVAGHDK